MVGPQQSVGLRSSAKAGRGSAALTRDEDTKSGANAAVTTQNTTSRVPLIAGVSFKSGVGRVTPLALQRLAGNAAVVQLLRAKRELALVPARAETPTATASGVALSCGPRRS